MTHLTNNIISYIQYAMTYYKCINCKNRLLIKYQACKRPWWNKKKKKKKKIP